MASDDRVPTKNNFRDFGHRYKPFGWDTMVEKDQIERRLIAEEGYKPGSVELFFAVSKAYTDAAKGKPTLRERQKAARARGEHWVAPAPGTRPGAPLRFTEAEIEYLVGRLSGANDDVGRAILAKLLPETTKDPGQA